MSLPASWQVILAPAASSQTRGGDARLIIRGPDGTEAVFAVEVKRRVLYPADLPRTLAQLQVNAKPEEGLLLVAPFLGPGSRAALAEEGVSYFDATGNLRIMAERPALYLERIGDSKDPWKEDERSRLRSLRGAAAARVVRALCDFRPPYGVRALAKRADIAASSVSRVVSLLEREALLARDATGGISDVRWRAIIERWTQDYGLARSNRVTTYLEPRGLTALMNKLAQCRQSYAVTGSLAAVRLVPYAPPQLATLYVRDASSTATLLGLRRAERGINVLLVEPIDPVAFERTTKQEDICYAALSQVAADLLTSPGRAPEEADALLMWMEENEDAWRLPFS